jgi:hypothetical protein
MPAAGMNESTILEHARQCLQACSKCLTISAAASNVLDADTATLAHLDLRSNYEQLLLWTKNLGVFAQGEASLDYRLLQATQVRENICALLDMLRDKAEICELDADRRGCFLVDNQ